MNILVTTGIFPPDVGGPAKFVPLIADKLSEKNNLKVAICNANTLVQCVKNLNFENYVNLYVGTKSDTPRIYEEANERWEYAVCLAPNEEFTQVSFVNGIYTSKGGKHVEYICDMICDKIIEIMNKKKIKLFSFSIIFHVNIEKKNCYFCLISSY